MQRFNPSIEYRLQRADAVTLHQHPFRFFICFLLIQGNSIGSNELF